MDDIVTTYPQQGIDISALLGGLDISIIVLLIIGLISIAITIAVIIAIFDIKSNTARTQKELYEIKQQMSFISKSLEYQNKVISQMIKSGTQNTSSGSSSTWENNNSY